MINAAIATDDSVQIKTIPGPWIGDGTVCSESRHSTTVLLRNDCDIHIAYTVVFKADSMQRSTE